VRPWGLGPRVPLYVISPWSRGGWVNSQVFDHTSMGQFLERRFGITVPAISPWHRAVCGDISSAFDFVTPNGEVFPRLPDMKGSAAIVAAGSQKPAPTPPPAHEKLFQERGMRRSRALPYELHVHARAELNRGALTLTFRNSGRVGAVFHVYDKLHLDRIPRRYTVEAGKQLTDEWTLRGDEGRYELWVQAPNGFVREFRGQLPAPAANTANPELELQYDLARRSLRMVAGNEGQGDVTLTIRSNAYRNDGPWSLALGSGRRGTREWSLEASHHWYDFTVSGEGFERRFAGRMETGAPSFSDPAV
jgi:phospholipase C